MDVAKFKLLMWKNYRLRRHHWIVTLIEFALPILVAFIIVKITSSLTGKTTAKRNATIYSPIPRSNFSNNVDSVQLCYAPINPVIDNFMDQIRSYFDSIDGFTNEAELVIALNESARIGIFFKNIVSNESLPDKLNYALRNVARWGTKILYPELVSPGPYQLHPYYFKHFAAVQLLINENFIKLKTNRTLPKELEFEWFPYPEYTSNTGPRSWISGGVSFFVILVVLIVSVPLINDIIEEKDSGVKELMKITGLGEWLMWFSWFVHALIVSFVSFSIVTIILTYPFNGPGTEAIHFVQFSVLWLFLILYCVANVSFCFMFSSIFHKTAIVSSVFLISFSVLVFGTDWLTTNAANNPLLKLVTLTPVGAFKLGINNIRYYEEQGVEFTWTSASSSMSENNENAVPLSFCLFMLVFDAFLYFFLALYISEINPGKFGARKLPLFVFQGLFSRFSNSIQTLENLDDKAESEFIEPAPANVEPTILIKDLHKHYGPVYAVKGVDLNIYPGEITALLGHNGAGKTTTMSMMTGLTSPSAGSVHFKNMDIFKDMENFRRSLGFCPQENRTLPYLSVVEHLLFFGQLKGTSRKEAEAEANEYLNMMEMQSKRNALANELSGGMKRKLCLSIALMGKAEVLILDEPTSGMDVQSRRKLWDLLLSMRGKRTIIFTTHYMEEADALGDRIAIMNHGVIVCHGTAIFLKKAYGTGYELTITKVAYGSDSIDRTIKNVLPNVSREFETPKEVVYKLPLTETNKFPILFKNLESGMSHLGIEQMAVAATTMEHVFLKAGGISLHDSKSIGNMYTNSELNSDFLTNVEGVSLFFQQIRVLLKKKYLYTSRNLYSVFTRIILPTLIGIFLLSLLNNIDLSPEPALDLSMSTYPASTLVLKNNLGDSDFEKHLSEYVSEKKGSLIIAVNTPIEKELLEEAKDILKYNKNYISAFELNSTMTKVLSNPMLIHSLPITITTYSNVLLRQFTNNRQYSIETSNHPVQKSQNSTNPNEMCGTSEMSFIFFIMWFLALAFYTVDLTSYFAFFVNMERIDGFQHIQIMSHVSPFVYWMSTLMFDLMFFLVVTGLRVCFYKLIDHTDFLGFGDSLEVFIVIVVLYGISGLLYIYVTGYLSGSKEGSHMFLFISNLTYAIVVTIIYTVEKLSVQSDLKIIYKLLYYITKAATLAIPSLNFMSLFIKLMVIFNSNTSCSRCSEELKAPCEALYKRKSYFEFASKENTDGILLEVIFLLVDIVLYSTILSFINMGYLRFWFNSLKNSIYGTDSTNSDHGDQDVQKEFDKVQQYKELGPRNNTVALLVDGLRKNYISWFKPSTAVSDVSFIVRPGECFGLLGVNGAGKSTTFKMLTAEIVPTLGDSSIENVKMSTDKSKYLSMAGYCSQTNCFIEELTGREMLSMIAAMRGVSRNENEALVNKWVKIIGLEEFQNQRCGTYSGGNKRKLCTAMSLIGDPRVVFLDEPTSGVDPVSRRNLYDVIGQTKQAGQALILTSHSMEECETLCDRLTIMVSGVMKCIGTTQHLKKCYAQGFSVLIKINDVPEEINTLKKNMSLAFNAEHIILKDEHMGLLHYQITDTSLPWSVLFEKMEALKSHHENAVEDYVLTDTTLEEVFITFAKESSSHTSENKSK